MYLEVESNPNCEAGVFARFKEIESARRVIQVRSFDRSAVGEWCWITGWTDDPSKPCCPAFTQRVEDSGAGLAYLVYGGRWGVRLKPIALQEEWNIDSPDQWGEAYLLLADAKDLRYADVNSQEGSGEG
jgi:hypothetical protein